MKKLSSIVMACLLVLGMTQCKKNEPTNNNTADDGNRVSITLKLDNGGQKLHPEEENGLASVVYDNGDVIYVGSDGKYVGCLTYNGTLFAGSINDEATEGQPLQFIFMGGQTIDGLTENNSTECTFNIGDQSNGLAVISCAPSNEDFSLTNLSYTTFLRNKCALVKFDLGSVSTDAAISLTGMKTEATIGFNGTVTNGTATGNIATYGTGSTRYAVVLSDQEAVTEGTISAEDYAGTFSIPTAAYTNAFLTDATITATSNNPVLMPLTLEALTDGIIRVSDPKSGMKYSVNGGEKITIGSFGADINVSVGDKVAFYGSATSYAGTNIVGTYNGAQVKAYGNIMSLVDEDNFATATTLTEGNTFNALFNYDIFNSNTTLIDASGLLLPAMTLTESCYANMFLNCTALTGAPELPATTLAERCYETMFYNCTSLTTAPELPATTLANNCYSYMFYNCTSLTTAPALPATTLVTGCYSSMFYNCSQLNSITCLATSGMNANSSTNYWLSGVADNGTFYADPTATWPTGNNGIPTGWTRKNPDGSPWVEPTPLTLEALSDGNIQVNISGTLSTGMKYSVNNGAKALITTTTTIDVNAGDKVQFYGNGTSISAYGFYPSVKLLGSAQTKVYGNIMSLIDEGNYASCTTLPNQEYVFSGLFWGNVNLTDASGLLLPATTLAPYCYASMFRGCSSLQTAPELLPAPELAPNCYYYMFYGCTSLTTVPALPATMLANSCYAYMFEDCKGLQTVSSDLLPATTLDYSCYTCMFYGCTGLTTAPTLPATTLANECYYRMFENCSHLNSITCLATSGINSGNSTMFWVGGVASSGTFTKAAGASWPTGSHGIPSGWTVVSQ